MIHLQIPPQTNPLKVKMTPHFEIRERFEGAQYPSFATNFNLIDVKVPENVSVLRSRVRFGAEFTSGSVSAEFAYQYTHAINWNTYINNSNDRADTVRGLLRFKAGRGNLVVGRQSIRLGNERLFGEADWSPTSFAFDAVRYQDKNFDAFIATPAILPFNKHHRNERIAAVSIASRGGNDITLFAARSYDAGATAVRQYTLDQSSKRKWGLWSVEAEVAGQFGNVEDQFLSERYNIRAGAFHARAGYQASKSWEFSADANFATGGSTSGTTHFFDPMYPSAHDKYGLMDLSSWSNIQMISLAAKHRVSPKMEIKGQYHRMYLQSKDGGWYNVLGLPNPLSRNSGNYGVDLGHEFDLGINYRVDSEQTVVAGLGVFQPGTYIQQRTFGPSKQKVLGFVQWTIKF